MNFAAIILAAGLSRRMGVLKPLLPVGGQSAILRCFRTAKEAGIRDIYVVTGHRHNEIEAELDSPYIHFINNPAYREGMFSSVIAGLRALPPETDGFFLLPADCCAVRPDTLTALMGMFIAGGGNKIFYPAVDTKRGHPPLIPLEFTKEITSYDGAEGMKGYLRGYPHENMQTGDRGVLLDMDTPEDYAALLGHLGLPTYPDAAKCARLLVTYKTAPDIVEHGTQVALLATKIALLMEGKGVEINVALLRSACLLHDMVRQKPDHARAGANLLLCEGYPSTAILVGRHMEAPCNPATFIDEAALLYLADKLCRRKKLVRLEETLEAQRATFAGDPEALIQATRRLEYAKSIMELLHRQYGIRYEDVLR